MDNIHYFLTRLFNFDFWWIKIMMINILVIIGILIYFRSLWSTSNHKLKAYKISAYAVIILLTMTLIFLILRFFLIETDAVIIENRHAGEGDSLRFFIA